jgi:hypothetical protein
MTEENEIHNESEKVFLTERQLARRRGSSIKKIQKDRTTGEGPIFHRFGSSIRYHIDDVIAHERQNRRGSTSASAPPGD